MGLGGDYVKNRDDFLMVTSHQVIEIDELPEEEMNAIQASMVRLSSVGLIFILVDMCSKSRFPGQGISRNLCEFRVPEHFGAFWTHHIRSLKRHSTNEARPLLDKSVAIHAWTY